MDPWAAGIRGIETDRCCDWSETGCTGECHRRAREAEKRLEVERVSDRRWATGAVLIMIGILAFLIIVGMMSMAKAQPLPYAPEIAPPPPQPIGWVFTRYTVCDAPALCPVVYVSVGADGLNVRPAGPDSPPIAALVNGTPLLVLARQGSWTLVAPACDLIPTGAWSWTAGVPLIRCYVWF
jgi:hypothetical protein